MVLSAQPARVFRTAAQLSLGAAIITSPLRYRWVLWENLLPPIYPDFTDVLLFISDGFLLATLGFWVANRLLVIRQGIKINSNTGKSGINWSNAKPRFDAIFSRKAERPPGIAWLTLPIFALVLLAWLTAPFSIAPIISFYHALRLTILTGVFLNFLLESVDFRLVIVSAWIQVISQSVIGIAQVMRQHSVNLAYLGELELDPAWSGVSIVWSEGQRYLRAYGLTDHPNILGGLLAFGLVLILFGHFNLRYRWRPLIAAGFTLGSLGLLLTFSRAAWLAFFASALLLLVLLRKSHQSGVISGWFGLFVGSALILAPFIWHFSGPIGVRINFAGSFESVPAENQAIGERRLLNQAGLEILAKYPITGSGLGTFPLAMQKSKPDWELDFQPAHLAVLDAAVELGLMGGLLYFFILAVPWLMMLINRRKFEFTPELAGASALLLALTIVGFFDYYTWMLPPGRLWQWLAWGLWAAAYHSSSHNHAYA